MLLNRLKRPAIIFLLILGLKGIVACQQNDEALLALEGNYSIAYFRANDKDTTFFTDTATGISYTIGENRIRFTNGTYRGSFSGTIQDSQLPIGAIFQGEFYFSRREYRRADNNLNLSIFPKEITLAVRTAQIVNNATAPTDTFSLDTIVYDFGRRYLFNGIWNLAGAIPRQAGEVLELERQGTTRSDSTTRYEIGLRREE